MSCKAACGLTLDWLLNCIFLNSDIAWLAHVLKKNIVKLDWLFSIMYFQIAKQRLVPPWSSSWVKRKFLEEHFLQLYISPQQLICLHTFTFTMTGDCLPMNYRDWMGTYHVWDCWLFEKSQTVFLSRLWKQERQKCIVPKTAQKIFKIQMLPTLHIWNRPKIELAHVFSFI